MGEVPTKPDEPGLVLGWSLLFTLVALQVAALLGGLSVGNRIGVALIGALFLELGIIVLVSYFYPRKSFFFRRLMSLVERLHHSSSRKWAFFWATLFLVGGATALHRALSIA